MDQPVKPSKEHIRAWLSSRRQNRLPLPDWLQLQRELGWGQQGQHAAAPEPGAATAVQKTAQQMGQHAAAEWKPA